ncbi:hypothetical protein PPL_01642 [Heterostelium album PN500]|uniref:4a-hydroxytetrahydrobiopterin dehydratase n=1 Tax=Heterostelium pallidum (strain ATCC 26659 / Pp 5 / PN500) TaxID=670386 RepID=D3B028_HETP5|nr:hypothetical protein PPL_01642 [Heterostelium album PN500]EFA84652.1 hypothetical protein PPL_01642 [Heterostelium album PN500]|eukprot:XP_020436765.1 hypothetical protein PPL_01642 [Heterostelium album PN500]
MSSSFNDIQFDQQQNQFCSLSDKKCKPCEGGDVYKLSLDKSKELLEKIHKNWTLSSESEPFKISRKWRMPFPKSVELVNSVAQIAEDEGHHPDISIKSYWNLEIELYTHALNGLSENDFIVASKIDDIPLASYEPPKRKKAINTSTSSSSSSSSS